ncbi:MAG TPA: hypothetical protein VEA69_22150, partial [Tepidisphaeraceae bacterium]|nr:hypothetical protein [Tepidisphaeraceae bacterium]
LGTAQLWNRLTSAGTIEVAAGKLLSVTNGSSTPNVISGPVVLNAGSRLSFSGSASTTVTLSGGVSFAGTGTLMNSGVLNVDAALTMPGGIDVSGSVTTGTAVNVNQPVTVSGASIVNGTTIKGPAVATFADLTLVSANVKARVAVAEGGRLMLGHSGYSSTTNTLYGAVIDVAGTLGAPGSVTRTLDGTLSTVNVLSTGTFAPGTTLQLRTPTAGQGVANTIDNRGLISLDGKRLELYSGWNLTNAGTIRVRNGGALLMLGSSDYGYSGAGIVDVDGAGSGASLTQVAGATFSGTYTIGAGSSISFFGGRFAPATLTNAGTIYLRSAVDTAMTIPGNVSTNGTTTVDAPLTIGGKLALGPDTFTATALTGTGSVTTPNLSTRATTIDVDVDVTDGSATTFQSTVNLTDATIRLAGGRTIAGTSFRAPVGATGRVEVKSGATVTLPAAGRATLGPGVGLAATGTGTLANAGTLDVDAGRLTVTAGWALENAGTVRARNGGMVFVTSGGGIANSGKIDLSTGGLAVLTGGGAGTSTEAVRAQLVAGRNDGTWDGATGIVSADAAATGGAQAVGYALAGELLRIGGAETAVWNGVTVDAGAVLVRHTLLGDADLNGTVGLNDLVVLANHYGAAGGWAQGDFDYNGEIALNDLVVLANQYGSSVTSPVAAGDFAADWALAQELAAGGATGVPEPGAVGLAGLGGAAMFGRRPRRRR